MMTGRTRIGLAYDLKEAVPVRPDQPEDALEEYDSRATVDGIAAGLEALGHPVLRLGGGRHLLETVLHDRPDLVFNIAEGLGNYRSREAQVPSVLEMLDIPYTGSDPQCLAICLDKPLTKDLVAHAGVTTPAWRVIKTVPQLKATDWARFPFPAFVKPEHEGSSMGIRAGSPVESAAELLKAVPELLERYRQPVMVEQFIVGEEITVGVIGNSPPKVIGIMRVVPRKADARFVYSLDVKRDYERLVDYEAPARLAPAVLKSIEESSLTAFSLLGCRDISRVDFRVDAAGTPYFLEINPLPGLNPKSGDIVIMSGLMGWGYQSLIGAVVNAAEERYARASERRHRL